MTDFLDDKRREIAARLQELEPLVEEYNRLAAAASALQGIDESAETTPAPLRRGPGRSPGPGKAGRPSRDAGKAGPARAATATRGRRAGRRKGSGTRSAQALSLVATQPGITIPELAARMGIKQNYLYRVLPALEQEGKLVRQDRGWHPGEQGGAYGVVAPREVWCPRCKKWHPVGKHKSAK